MHQNRDCITGLLVTLVLTCALSGRCQEKTTGLICIASLGDFTFPPGLAHGRVDIGRLGILVTTPSRMGFGLGVSMLTNARFQGVKQVRYVSGPAPLDRNKIGPPQSWRPHDYGVVQTFSFTLYFAPIVWSGPLPADSPLMDRLMGGLYLYQDIFPMLHSEKINGWIQIPNPQLAFETGLGFNPFGTGIIITAFRQTIVFNSRTAVSQGREFSLFEGYNDLEGIAWTQGGTYSSWGVRAQLSLGAWFRILSAKASG